MNGTDRVTMLRKMTEIGIDVRLCYEGCEGDVVARVTLCEGDAVREREGRECKRANACDGVVWCGVVGWVGRGGMGLGVWCSGT